MAYTIYLRRNKVNGKCYVGQTGNFDERQRQWRCLKLTYANKNISNDRVKYGFDAWTVEILAEADTRDEAWELEQRFINDFNTLWPNGYNLAKGGGGANGCKHSDKTRQKISEANKGEKHPMYGTNRTNRKDISKIVYQYTLDGVLKKVWPSIRECGRNGYNQGAVCACCNGKLKKYKGHRWSYTKL